MDPPLRGPGKGAGPAPSQNIRSLWRPCSQSPGAASHTKSPQKAGERCLGAAPSPAPCGLCAGTVQWCCLALLWPKCWTCYLVLLNLTLYILPYLSHFSSPLLQSLPTLQQINTPTLLGAVHEVTNLLDPFTTQIINKDNEQDLAQH